MKLKKITQLDILYLSISMFVIVVVWIVFSLYHTYVTSTISDDLQMQITPIDGSFDTATIDKLKSRTKTTPLAAINQASSSAAISPSPTPAVGNLEVTPSAEPTPTGQKSQITGTITPTQALSPTVIPTITP